MCRDGLQGSPQGPQALRRFAYCRRCLRLPRLCLGQPVQLDRAIPMLDQRRARLHPIPAIEVLHLPHLANLGMVDMPTHHPMKTAAGALVGNGILEVADEVHRAFDLVLQVRRQ
ncbi:hypothetical protein D3C75_987870 [compost metagenome]